MKKTNVTLHLMKTVFINTSDIAAYIGQNKWDIITPFERLWKKCDSDYDSIVDTVKQVYKDDKEKLEKVNVLVLDKKQQVEQYIKPETLKKHLESTSDTVAEKTKNINTLINKLEISPDEKIKLQQHTSSLVNTTHGIMNEQKVVDIYEKKFNVILDTSQKFHKKQLSTDYESKYTWMICGKVDGIYDSTVDGEESYIVEIKNRVKGFFNNVRNYENTQVQMYMWMLEKYGYTMLEEHYKGKIKSTKVYKDTGYTRYVLGTLVDFIKNFEEKFLNDKETKLDYVVMSSYDKTEFIESLMMD
jgi:hypothetical protein